MNTENNLSITIPDPFKKEADLDDKYPNRHKEIHKACCKHCPSAHDRKNGIIDPEAEDIKNGFPKELIALEFLFVCAWRPDKLCKGNCDFMEIDEEFIKNVHNNLQDHDKLLDLCVL